jgi:hypothetical protein
MRGYFDEHFYLRSAVVLARFCDKTVVGRRDTGPPKTRREK